MNVLIIEDSKTIGHFILSSLENYGYSCEHTTSRNFSEKLYDMRNFTLVILNAQPEISSARKIIAEIRQSALNNYILGITSAGKWEVKVEFLKNGGDDVLNYPFSVQEMLARIQALLRRPSHVEGSEYVFKMLKVIPGERRVYLADEELNLKNKEYKLLEYLVRNHDRAVSRSELMDNVWDYRKINSSNTVDVHINRLRKSIKSKDLIKTVHGFGYKLSSGKEVEIRHAWEDEEDD